MLEMAIIIALGLFLMLGILYLVDLWQKKSRKSP